MPDLNKLPGYRLPSNPDRHQGRVAQGFVRPAQDRNPQIHSVPPKRVLPIIFIPGIMGSNLRMSAERQSQLGTSSNIAWRPDKVRVTVAQYDDSAKERQLRLDPLSTELDVYDPTDDTQTGDPDESSDQRNDSVTFPQVYDAFNYLDGPLLQNDLPGTSNRKTKDQKARERGWGEVYFSSYKHLLSTCEVCLNAAFSYGSLNAYLRQFVKGIAPSAWQAHPTPALKEIDEKLIRDAVNGCWFPVHAMGYNWLRENAEAGKTIARRITELMQRYQDQGFGCEKVILVTHSMGGLVARAVLHPDIGNLEDKVLGVVHGVMPANGAGTAYKRVRCGFEGNGIGAKILGQFGPNVTAVLANAQGGLELLPTQAYGNHWLQIRQNKTVLISLPVHGDPYEEIYKIPNKWFGLLREEWINPARTKGAGFKRTAGMLDRAKDFHNAIANTYHSESYAHYGADPEGKTWYKVVWEIDAKAKVHSVDMLTIDTDSGKGILGLFDPTLPAGGEKLSIRFDARLLDPVESGDQTVPVHSADAQLRSGRFKGVFCQTGYEHQESYSNSAVLAATLYSLIQIASKMKWSKQ